MLFERTETEANIHAKPLHLQFKATVRHSKFLGTLVQVQSRRAGMTVTFVYMGVHRQGISMRVNLRYLFYIAYNFISIKSFQTVRLDFNNRQN